MALKFHPRPGQVLICDFAGYVIPEMVKKRPVVVVSPRNVTRQGLTTIVPLSTTVPNPVCDYHYKLVGNPIPGDSALEVWAKCDMVASVSLERLDRIKVGRGNFQVGNVSMEQVWSIRHAAAASLGVRPAAQDDGT